MDTDLEIAQQLSRQAFQIEKARRESIPPASGLGQSLFVSMNQSQIANDPTTYALNLQKELRKSKQATLLALEKLHKAEKKGEEVFAEWEAAVTLMETEKKKGEIELQIVQLTAAEEIKAIKQELIKMGTRADFENVRQQLQKYQAENQDLSRLNAELHKVVSTHKTKSEQAEILEKKTQGYECKVEELEKNLSNHLKIAEALKAQNEALKQDSLLWSSKLEQSETVVKEKTGKHAEMLEKLKTTSKSLAAKNAQIKDLERAVEALREENANIIKKIEGEKENLESANTSFEIELGELQRLNKDLQAKYNQISSQHDRSNLVEKELNENLIKEQKRVADLQSENSQLTDHCQKLLHDTEVAMAEKEQIVVAGQTKTVQIQRLSEEISSLKNAMDRSRRSETGHHQVAQERDSYRADVGQILSSCTFLEYSFPELANLFEEAANSRSNPYQLPEHNLVVTKMQILTGFLKEYKEQSVCVSNFCAGRTVLLQKNSNGHFEIVKKPEDPIEYFLDPEVVPIWEQLAVSNKVLMGSILFIGTEIRVESLDNPYHLPKGVSYKSVYVQPATSEK